MATEGESILNIQYPEDDLNTAVLLGKKLKYVNGFLKNLPSEEQCSHFNLELTQGKSLTFNLPIHLEEHQAYQTRPVQV